MVVNIYKGVEPLDYSYNIKNTINETAIKRSKKMKPPIDFNICPVSILLFVLYFSSKKKKNKNQKKKK